MWLIALFFLSLLILRLAWKCLRKSILDASRDAMFDLRESVRAKFIEEGWGLDCIEYRRIRDLINASIRYTEDKTLFEVITTNRAISENEIVQRAVLAYKNEILSSTNPKIEKYLKSVFSDLADELLLYLFKTNIIYFHIIIVVYIICRIINPIAKCRERFFSAPQNQMDAVIATVTESQMSMNQAV